MFESNAAILEANVTISESTTMIFEANMVTWSTMYHHIWAFETPPPNICRIWPKNAEYAYSIYSIYFEKKKDDMSCSVRRFFVRSDGEEMFARRQVDSYETNVGCFSW